MKTIRFPHPLVLLVGFILLACLLSYVLPAGIFERHTDAATGRAVVVAGSYYRVAPTPVSPLQALVDIPKGLVDAASVIFLVFLAGGAFTVVDLTGALRRGVDWLLVKFQGREALVIPIISVLFATMGALENMQEEIVPLVPVLLILMRRIGYPTVTAAAVSIGSAAVGAAFSPLNPFQVGIAQKLAQLPLLSGGGFRLVFLLLALAIWIVGTVRYALRHRVQPEMIAATAVESSSLPRSIGGLLLAASALLLYYLLKPYFTISLLRTDFDLVTAAAFTLTLLMGLYILMRRVSREAFVLLLLFIGFGFFAYGVLELGWEFEQMAALFFTLGVVAGLVGGLGLTGTAEGFIAGFRDIAFSALLIGFARAIFVVLEQGQIVDTIVNSLSAPLAGLPAWTAALGMMGVHTALHLPVPSVSGQAVLTMPLLVPLSDLIGLSRQVTVLAYQYGAGLCELITPTNGALMAIVAACGVRFDEWWKFAFPLYLSLLALAAAAIITGIAVKL
ncbi:YfcC family protein [Hymenobacter sp. HSC-4F20]|uniref:YfcC family protein n=1 Tax=Hymenobacter sp. HSC-4F20 TaxID=2864135 RepID=UPI001C739BA7|nr:YfcC family protein [Hymenobacter sp. HSC-4F20]MBX0288846.1 YfcC family protein [Hymenobacter sp. HSC-4F20]